MLKRLGGWAAACEAMTKSLHVPVKNLWSFGFVSDTSILLDDSLMEKRWVSAESSKLAACHSAPILLLGDKKSGKTGLSRTLRNLPPVERRGDRLRETLAVEETHAEVSCVDMSWADWGHRLISDIGITEHVNAMLYFVASEILKRKESLGKVDDKVRIKFSIYSAFIGFVLQLIIFMIPALGFHLHFIFLLWPCYLLYAPVNRSHNIHYIMAYGSTITTVVFHFAMTQNYCGTFDDAKNTLLAVLTLSFLFSLLLGAGCGGGLALAFSLCLRSQSVNPGWQGCLILGCGIIGIIDRKQKGQRMHPTIQASIFVAFTFMAVLSLHTKIMPLFYGVLGFLLGYITNIGLACGRKVAPVLSLGSRHLIIAMILGLILGLPLIHYINWTLIEPSHGPAHFVVALLACLFIFYMQYKYYYLAHTSSHRMPLIRKLMDNSPDPRKPAKFTLIECSGDERFREIQHIYMSPFAIYIITFRVTDIDNDGASCGRTFKSLSHWINRVAANLEGNDRRVYLVATHHDITCSDPEERRRRSRILERKLTDKYSHLLVQVPNRDAEARNPRVIFHIKNTIREEGDEELKRLRRAIMNNATTEEVPMSWFHFLDVIRETRQHKEGTIPSVIPSFHELFDKVNLMCELHDNKQQFKEMLQFFSDCGEIFFDSHQESFSPYVLLDRRILEKIVCELVGTRERCHLITSSELHHFINLNLETAPPERITEFLINLNFLIPIHGKNKEEQSFLIPFNLPRTETPEQHLNESSDILCAAIFDFDSSRFYPSPLFLQLLALCQRLQDCSKEEFAFATVPASAVIFRNAGTFVHGNIRYTISLIDHTPYKIWVRMSSIESHKNAKTHASTLMHQLNCLVQHLCATHFRTLDFTLQLVCECSLNETVRENLHFHEYRMAKASFPYTMPMRHNLPCSDLPQGMVFPWPTQPVPSKLLLCSTQHVDFRFATDICVLSHKSPPSDLLNLVRKLSEAKAKRPIVLSVRSLEERHTNCCDQFLLQNDHLQESSLILVLIHSDICRACREKFQATQHYANKKVVPIVVDEEAEKPHYFNIIKCLYYKEESLKESLKKIFNEHCFNT